MGKLVGCGASRSGHAMPSRDRCGSALTASYAGFAYFYQDIYQTKLDNDYALIFSRF